MTWKIFIPLETKGQARPRHMTTKSGMSITYKAKAQRLDEQKLIAAIQQERPPERLPGPLRLDLVAVLPVPASWSKKRREGALGGLERPTKRPDASNILKNLEDVLQGIVFEDDKNIVDVSVSKIYGDKPGYQITLTEMQHEIDIHKNGWEDFNGP